MKKSVAWAFPAAVIILLLAGLFLRIHAIDSKDIRLDEATTMKDAYYYGVQQTMFFPRFILPLPIMLENVWLMIVGADITNLRLLSAVLNIIAVGITGLISWRVFKRRDITIFTILLTTFSTALIDTSRVGRHYSLFLFATALNFYLFYQCIIKERKHTAIPYVVSAIILVLSHQFSILLLGAQFLIALFYGIKKWVLYHIPAAAASAFFYYLFLKEFVQKETETLTHSLNWIPGPSEPILQRIIGSSITGVMSPSYWLLLGGVFLLLISLVVLFLSKKVFMVIPPIVYGGILILASIFNPYFSLMNMDYFLPVILFSGILIAIGAARFKLIGVPFILILVIANLVLIPGFYNERKDFAHAVTYIFENNEGPSLRILPYSWDHFWMLHFSKEYRNWKFERRETSIVIPWDVQKMQAALEKNRESWILFVNISSKPDLLHSYKPLLSEALLENWSISTKTFGDVTAVHLLKK